MSRFTQANKVILGNEKIGFVQMAIEDWIRISCPNHEMVFVRSERDDQRRIKDLYRCKGCKTEYWRESNGIQR